MGAISKARVSHKKYVTPRIVRFCQEVAKRKGLHIVSTDKDGGFALTDDSCRTEAVRQLLCDDQYKEVVINDPSMIDLFEPYYDAVRAIFVGNNYFRNALFSDSLKGLSRMLATVQLTVKTYKNGGDVVCRAIHA